MAKQPWFKLFSADFLTDPDLDKTPLAAQSVIVRMWCVCNIEGSIPRDPEEIARLTRCKLSDISQCESHFETFFVSHNGSYRSKRMEREKEKSQKARDSAAIRWKETTDDAVGNAKRNAKRNAQSQIVRKPEKKEKNPSRYAEFVELSKLYWESLNPERKFTFGARDGKIAKEFLKRFDATSIEDFKSWFNNMIFSDNVNVAWLPYEFIPHLHKYADGRLDTFGRPKP